MELTSGHRQPLITTDPEAPILSPILLRTAGLLALSNIFMTFAWYAHLRNLGDRPWYLAAIVSWGIALFEYLLQVPANRIGYTALSLSQLKILQEVIALIVFAPFAVLYMRQPIKLDYLWAALCLVGAVYFVFRTPATP
ncbi:MAG TPA: DMT family protein [Gemmatimonadales bacterium]|nr:DMT family protein [Gemmatimonadales bacterium]